MASSSRAREARVDITVGRDKLDRGLRDAKKGIRGFASDVKGAIGSAGKKLASGVLEGVGALAGVGGGLGIAGIVTDVVDFERSLTRFQIATDGTAAKTAKLRAELGRVSSASGIARNELLSGASAYVALTGDADGAASSVKVFAKVANATGASMEDIANTAAAMKQNLGIDPKDFEAGFSALAVQGKAGAVELRELATLLSGIAPTFSNFDGGKGAEGLAVMGAALQVVRQGFGSSSEAATGFQGLMVAITKNADKFAKAGVKIYDKDPKTGAKRLRDFRDIIDGIAESKLMKDPTKLGKAFGRDEAARAFQQLVLNRGMLDDLIAKSKDKNAIDRDAATYLESPAGRLEKLWNGMKLAIAEALTPDRIKAFITALEHAAQLIQQITDWLGHPKEAAKEAGRAVAPYAAALIPGVGPAISSVAAVKAGVNLYKRHKAAQQIDAERSGRYWDALYRTGSGEGADAVVAGQDRAYADLVGGKYGRGALDEATAQARAQSPWGPGFAPSAERVINALGEQVRAAQAIAFAQQQVKVVVQIGQDAVAKASANAPAHRTRPGGV